MNTTNKTGLGLTIIAFCLILVGTFSPGWVRIQAYTQSGLFYACNFIDVTCAVYPIESFSTANIATFVLMLVALLLMTTGFFLALSGCKGDATKLKASGCFFIVGGLVSLAAAATFTALTMPTRSIIARIVVQWYFYGYWCTWIGGVFGLIGGVLSVHSSKTTAV